MEALSLLKYWRTSAVVPPTPKPRAVTKTIAAAVSPYSSDSEDGPFFDLEFALPNDNETENAHPEKESVSESDSSSESSNEEDENEVDDIKLILESNEFMENENVAICSADEVLCKEDVVSIDDSEKTHKLSLKSATKFGVLLLKLKKPKSENGDLEKSEKNDSTKALTNSKIDEKQGKQSGKFYTVKLKIEEAKAPIVSYFSRDNSSKDSDEKKLSKEVHKYFKMVKPLYVRVSKKYVEANLKQGNSNLQAGLKVVKKHLGKSRSASAAVSPPHVPVKMGSDRRDDSLLQVQDGIQGAILHCKKSFNASRDGESSSSSSKYCRSVSDPSYEKFSASTSSS